MQMQSLATHHASELDRLGDEIAELSAHLDAATARLLELIRAFDARGGWNTGFASCAAWLSWRVGLDLGAARERVRVARALGTLPLLAEALARGELSYAKVRALTRVATPETEVRLLGVGRAGTAAHVERIVRSWRCVDRRAGARAFPRQRLSAWPATRAEWSCATTARGASWKSGPGPGRFPPHCGAPSSIGIKAAASRGAMGASPRGITSATGPTEAQLRYRTSRCSAAGIIAPYTRRATRSRAYPTAPSSSGDRTATRCPRCRRRRRCQRIPSRRSESLTTRRACVSTHGRDVRVGSGSH